MQSLAETVVGNAHVNDSSTVSRHRSVSVASDIFERHHGLVVVRSTTHSLGLGDIPA